MIRRGWVLAVVLVGLIGCTHDQAQRGQSADEPDPAEQDISNVKLVFDVVEFSTPVPIQVSGVGLVINLDGTGGGNPPGQFRQMLEDQLRKQGVSDVKELMTAPDKALVIVTARIPYGTRRGDPIAIEVTLPPQSKATSLRGGYLVDCPLRNYESTQNLSSNAKSQVLLQGHILAKRARVVARRLRRRQ